MALGIAADVLTDNSEAEEEVRLLRKIAIAFVCSVVATVLIWLIVPEGSRLVGIPGTLLIIYGVRSVYRRNHKGKGQ